MYLFLGIFLLYGLQEHAKAQSKPGEECISNSGLTGICMHLMNCPAAVNQIRYNVLPKMCYVGGTETIVCCTGISNPPMTTLRLTTTTRKTINFPFWDDSQRNRNKTTTTSAPSTTNYSVDTKLRFPTRPVTQPPTEAPKKKVPGDISQAKCKEYAQYALEDVFDISPVPKPPRKRVSCPYDKQALIVGGTHAEEGEFPHMAQLGYQTKKKIAWLCGGTIISPNFVLTAAHCLTSKALGGPKSVRVGVTKQTETYHAQIRNVIEIFKNPHFKNKYHDIGLIKLEENLELNLHARPACLFTEKSIPEEKAIASGWGRDEGGRKSQDLLKVTLGRFTVQECNEAYQKIIVRSEYGMDQGILDDYMICYGSKTEKKDACQGDSGGPLEIYHEDTEDIKCMYSIIGITSFGLDCNTTLNMPGIYTRVSAYTEWIENIVWPQ